jgi:hypothetical protein
LVQPKVGNSKHFHTLKPELKRLSVLVSEVLYNFSKGKLVSFLQEPTFAAMLKQYLSEPFSIGAVKTSLDSEEATKVYGLQID